MAKFSWSFSRLKNFENCPERYHEVDVLKNYKDSSSAMDWGEQVHKAMAAACSMGATLPPDMAEYQPWVERVRNGSGHLYVEQQYAITRSFQKTQWFAPNVWARCIGDVVRVNDTVGMVLDWKTGKPKPDEYRAQLMLMAQALFSHYPGLEAVRSEFVWLNDNISTSEVYTLAKLAVEWPEMLARVAFLEQSHQGNYWPVKPGKLCGWCPVQKCAHWTGYVPGSR